MNIKYEVAREFNDGLRAGISPDGYDELKSAHWKAGYLVGYKMRPQKNDALNAYLVSVGAEPMSAIRLVDTNVKEQT